MGRGQIYIGPSFYFLDIELSFVDIYPESVGEAEKQDAKSAKARENL